MKEKKPDAKVNPVYLPPKKVHPALALLKKTKSQREWVILAELLRRPYS